MRRGWRVEENGGVGMENRRWGSALKVGDRDLAGRRKKDVGGSGYVVRDRTYLSSFFILCEGTLDM